MSARYGHQRRSGPPLARWLTLKYASKCPQCSAELPAGARAFYADGRVLTCPSVDCAHAVPGWMLTTEAWHGSPVSGSWVRVLTEPRRRGMVTR